MTERLYLDRPDVYMVADCDARDGGRARAVVCEHPDGAEYAAQLAASLDLPLHYQPEPGDRGRQRPRSGSYAGGVTQPA